MKLFKFTGTSVVMAESLKEAKQKMHQVVTSGGGAFMADLKNAKEITLSKEIPREWLDFLAVDGVDVYDSNNSVYVSVLWTADTVKSIFKDIQKKSKRNMRKEMKECKKWVENKIKEQQ